jgi:hypothetical protein
MVAAEADQAPEQAVRVAIHPRRLMDQTHMAFYTLLSDRIEVEAPEMTVHAQVAMDAFLHVDRRVAQTAQDVTHASYVKERVALLVVDEAGLPIVAIEIIGNAQDAGARAEAKASALDEAGIALVTVNELTPIEELWAQVAPHLEVYCDDAAVAL